MQRIEPAAAAVAGSSAVTGFVAQANEYMAFVAYGVAIFSGLLAIYSHFKRRRSGSESTRSRG